MHASLIICKRIKGDARIKSLFRVKGLFTVYWTSFGKTKSKMSGKSYSPFTKEWILMWNKKRKSYSETGRELELAGFPVSRQTFLDFVKLFTNKQKNVKSVKERNYKSDRIGEL